MKIHASEDALQQHLSTQLKGTHGAPDFEGGRGVEIEGGFRLDFSLPLEAGDSRGFYAVFVEEQQGFRLLDLSSKEGIIDRFNAGTMSGLDIGLLIFVIACIFGLAYIFLAYIKGLKGSP